MITLYSHQLQAIRANIATAMLDDANISNIIDFIVKLTSGDETLGVLATDVSLTNNLEKFDSRVDALLDELRLLQTMPINDINEVNMLSCKYSLLFIIISDRVFEGMLSNYLDLHIVGRLTKRPLKINRRAIYHVINEAINDASVSHGYIDTYDYFEQRFEESYTDMVSIATADSELMGNPPIDMEATFVNFRLLTVILMMLIRSEFNKKEHEEITHSGRSGLTNTIVKLFESLEDTLSSCVDMPTVLGVGGYVVDTVPAISLIEESDLEPTGVVLLDQDTPMAETFYDDLAETHSNYNLSEYEGRVGYLMANNIPIPRLNDMIRDEITSLYLHECIAVAGETKKPWNVRQE